MALAGLACSQQGKANLTLENDLFYQDWIIKSHFKSSTINAQPSSVLICSKN